MNGFFTTCMIPLAFMITFTLPTGLSEAIDEYAEENDLDSALLEFGFRISDKCEVTDMRWKNIEPAGLQEMIESNMPEFDPDFYSWRIETVESEQSEQSEQSGQERTLVRKIYFSEERGKENAVECHIDGEKVTKARLLNFDKDEKANLTVRAEKDVELPLSQLPEFTDRQIIEFDVPRD